MVDEALDEDDADVEAAGHAAGISRSPRVGIVGGHQKTSFIGHLPVYSSLISSAPKARVIGRSSSKGWKL
jgi:hypothetical protein